MYGYTCTLQTDTEVIAYMIDYLHRKMGLDFKEIAAVLAAPFWQTIAQMPPEERQRQEYLRNVFASQLITGPFSILVGFEGGLMALNDRLKLRSMVVGEKRRSGIYCKRGSRDPDNRTQPGQGDGSQRRRAGAGPPEWRLTIWPLILSIPNTKSSGTRADAHPAGSVNVSVPMASTSFHPKPAAW